MKNSFTLLLLVLALFSGTAEARAQTAPRHEIALSYGLGSSSMVVGVTASVFAAIFGKSTDLQFIGPVSGEYFYHVSDLVGVGGIACYAFFRDQSPEEGSINPISCYTLLPAVKFDWLRHERFGMYSKLGAGASWFSSDQFTFNLQASLVGAEFGDRVRGFLELGLGEQGFVLGGIRYRF